MASVSIASSLLGGENAGELASLASSLGLRTAADFLLVPPFDLAENLDVSLERAEAARRSVARAVVDRMSSSTSTTERHLPTLLSLSTSRPPKHVPTGLPSLDSALGGGFRRGIVTEVVGPAGAGKTQLCLCLAAAVLSASAAPSSPRSSAAGGVVWFDVEGAFSATRLVELARRKGEEEERRRRRRQENDDDDEEMTETDPSSASGPPPALLEALGRNVAVVSCSAASATAAGGSGGIDFLVDALSRLTRDCLRRSEGNGGNDGSPISLVVVDSVAAAARAGSEGGGGDRSRALASLSAAAASLASASGAAVVCVNQVVSSILSSAPTERGPGGEPGEGGGSFVAAALGTGWSHGVGARLVLEASDGPPPVAPVASPSPPARSPSVRWARIAKSPCCASSPPLSSFPYRVTASGIEAPSPSDPPGLLDLLRPPPRPALRWGQGRGRGAAEAELEEVIFAGCGGLGAGIGGIGGGTAAAGAGGGGGGNGEV